MKVESILRKLANDILTCHWRDGRMVSKGHVKHPPHIMDYVKARLVVASTNVRSRLRDYASLRIYGESVEELDD